VSLSIRVDLLQEAMGLVLDDLKATDGDGDAWAAQSRREFMAEHGLDGVEALVGLAAYLVHQQAVDAEMEPVTLAAELHAALTPPDGSAWRHKRRRAGSAEEGR
jgi:hypothetical protein